MTTADDGIKYSPHRLESTAKMTTQTPRTEDTPMQTSKTDEEAMWECAIRVIELERELSTANERDRIRAETVADLGAKLYAANEKLARLRTKAVGVSVTAGEDDSLWPEMKALRAELEE